MCEAVLDLCLDYPGIVVLVVRQKHTAITATTRKRFFQVLPPELVEGKKESGGEDWVDVKTSVPKVFSRVHFIGLDDPVKWFSSEIGALVVDEAHETAESDVAKMRARLRQRCHACEKEPQFDAVGTPIECSHMPLCTMLGFNPENPNHWLRSWFIVGAAETEYGFYKRELFIGGAESSVGDCEFVVARATDNPYIPKSYIEQTLGGMSKFERERYLEGKWLFVSGQCFFDEEALTKYSEEVERPKWVAESCGALTGADKDDKVKFRPAKGGPWAIFRPPVRAKDDLPAHRYIVAVDPSSGGSTDYTGIQVLDVEDFAQVSEFQAKLAPDLVADEAFRAAMVYNGATVVVETTGGWGAAIVRRFDHDLLPRYRGARVTKPRLYLRKKDWDKISNQWTEVYGWNTDTHSRVLMLDTLEQAIRERSLVLRSERTLQELLTFVWSEARKTQAGVETGPRRKSGAQSGENDDLVMSLAMAVTVFAQQPKTLRRYVPPEHTALVGSTGY